MDLLALDPALVADTSLDLAVETGTVEAVDRSGPGLIIGALLASMQWHAGRSQWRVVCLRDTAHWTIRS